MTTSHVTVKGLGRDNNENTRCTLNDDNWQAAIHRHNNDDGGDDFFAKLDYNTREAKFGKKNMSDDDEEPLQTWCSIQICLTEQGIRLDISKRAARLILVFVV